MKKCKRFYTQAQADENVYCVFPSLQFTLENQIQAVRPAFQIASCEMCVNQH